MKSIITSGIVLSRVNFQEADRILTILTPDNGKLRLIAKGVRREKSKLAGGVELLSENEISFIRGRGEIGTLVSSRLKKHYPSIIKDIDRTMYAYEVLKNVNKLTEDNSDEEYYHLVSIFMKELDDLSNELNHIKLWADMQLLETYGHGPELGIDVSGKELDSAKRYDFDYDSSAFTYRSEGLFNSGHIKLLRICRGNPPSKFRSIDGIKKFVEPTQRLAESIRKNSLNV